MNTQELFDAFRDVDPAWLKEADQLADRAAEQFSVTEAQDAAENEIQQIFAKHTDREARAASRRIAEYQTKAKAPDFTDLLGTASAAQSEAASGIPAERTAEPSLPVDRGSGNRIFRLLGGIAAAVALVSIGAFAGSVLTNRNDVMTVQPGAQISGQHSEEPAFSEEDGVRIDLSHNGASSGSYYAEFDENGNLVASYSGNADYTVLYQDCRLINSHTDMFDGAPAIYNSAYQVPNIYQPEGTPVELTLIPECAEDLLPGCEYRVVAEQYGEVLDITDPETGESVKSYRFTSKDAGSDNTHKISLIPDYSRDGSRIKIFVIIHKPDGTYWRSDSCMFRLYTAEPGASCTYKIDSSSTKISSFYSE